MERKKEREKTSNTAITNRNVVSARRIGILIICRDR